MRTPALALALTLASTAALAQEVTPPSFNDDGSVNAPVGWRKWVFVGAPLTPNALNGEAAPFPEFHSVYMEPGAFAQFE